MDHYDHYLQYSLNQNVNEQWTQEGIMTFIQYCTGICLKGPIRITAAYTFSEFKNDYFPNTS